MPTDRVRVGGAGLFLLLSVLVVGCSDETHPARSTTTEDAAAQGAAPPNAAEPSGPASPSSSPPGREAAPAELGTTDEAGGGNGTPQGATGATAAPHAAAEVPAATSATPTRLGALIEAPTDGALVNEPLPGAAAARGRLVARFPVLLRPVRGSAVETSSLSPSGQRLQVALVGSTTLDTDAVLRAYRIRFAARGVGERAAPPTLTGSEAAAFARGGSTVTVTVTRVGDRTTYTVLGSLHTGKG